MSEERVSIDIVTWARSTSDWASLYDVFCHLLAMKKKVDQENEQLIEKNNQLQDKVNQITKILTQVDK